MLLKLQEFTATLPTTATKPLPSLPTLQTQLSNPNLQFTLTHSTQEHKGFKSIVHIPDVGILADRYKNEIEVLDEVDLSLKLTIQHKYGGVYSGLNMKEREICYLGMGGIDDKGEWYGYLVELNTKTLELKRSLKTKDAVF